MAGPNDHMTLSGYGECCLKLWEEDSLEPKLEAYDDGTGTWTIGWGNTKGVYRGMRITRDQAEEMFQREIQPFVQAVRRRIKVPLKQGQFDAMTSFFYNLGEGAGDGLVAAINRGDFDAVPGIMALYNKARKGRNGPLVTWPGLVKRRAREIALWSGTYHDARIPASVEPEVAAPQPKAVEPPPRAIAAAFTIPAADGPAGYDPAKVTVKEKAVAVYKSPTNWSILTLFGVVSGWVQDLASSVWGFVREVFPDNLADVTGQVKEMMSPLQDIGEWFAVQWTSHLKTTIIIVLLIIILYRNYGNKIALVAEKPSAEKEAA